MKRIPLYVAIAALLLSGAAVYFAKSSSELVYVDVNKLIEGYSRTKEMKASFEKKSTRMKASVDSLLSNWQEEVQKYEKELATLSPKELKLKQEIMASKQRQISAYQQSIDQKIRDEDSKSSQTVINDINDYVKDYGKKHGYKVIFGASGSGNIMYAAESTDLTANVLQGLNEAYDKK